MEAEVSKHTVRHLARSCSDYHPILISNDRKIRVTRKDEGFKMQEMWFRYLTFEPLITNLWNSGNGNLLIQIKTLQEGVKEWNRTVFGNLFRRNARCQARIEGVQRV